MSQLPPGNLGTVEAPFLVGIMASCALFGITCAQTAYYYRAYPTDSVILKYFVAFLVLLEAAHLMLVGEAGHFLFVVCKMPENITGIFFVRTSFAVSFTLTVIITSLVQCFYAWRVRMVSRPSRLGVFAVAFILVTTFIQFVLGLSADVLLFVEPDLTHVHSKVNQGIYTTQLAIVMICDLAITLALVHFLNKSRTGFRKTENVIDRLIIYSVNVGVVTSIIAIVTFITFHALGTTTHFTAFTEIISKIYVNSLLVTLNVRKNVSKGLSGREASESYHMSSSGLGRTQVGNSSTKVAGQTSGGKSAWYNSTVGASSHELGP